MTTNDGRIVGDTNSVTIEAPLAVVFRYITQARFWTKWHADSKRVAGVTERPYLLGDTIYEQGITDGAVTHLFWHVVEYIENQHVRLYDEEGKISLVYDFEEEENGFTRYTRSTQYDPDCPASQEFRDAAAQASKTSVPHLRDKVMEEVEKEKELPNISR